MEQETQQVEPEVLHADGQPADKRKAWAVIAYFVFFLPLLTKHKDNPFVKFHVKQGLVLFISFFAQMVVGMVPVFGALIAMVLWIINVVLLILGVINSATGKQKELPLIGKFASRFDL